MQGGHAEKNVPCGDSASCLHRHSASARDVAPTDHQFGERPAWLRGVERRERTADDDPYGSDEMSIWLCLANIASGQKSLTSASPASTLRTMRAVIRTGAAVQSARATRRDLLLEILALRHQLGVLARSKRRFRPADRLFWLFLRWLWPRWREALVLVQPATVDRWHREGVRRCWRLRPRRRGRPRIDGPCRDLIRRIADENCLWGAPRIHGELLKLGIAISERTVSRYLHGRPTTRSQTWRTFFANHFGGQTFMSPVMFAGAHGEDIVVDAPDLSVRPAASIDASCRSIHSTSFDWGVRASRRPSACVLATIAFRTIQERARAAAATRRGTYGCNGPRGIRAGFLSCAPTGLCD